MFTLTRFSACVPPSSDARVYSTPSLLSSYEQVNEWVDEKGTELAESTRLLEESLRRVDQQWGASCAPASAHSTGAALRVAPSPAALRRPSAIVAASPLPLPAKKARLVEHRVDRLRVLRVAFEQHAKQLADLSLVPVFCF